MPRDRDIHVIIPFYKNAGLVAPLFNSLAACKDELASLNCTIIAINDSPDDGGLAAQLDIGAGLIPAGVPYILRTNAVNLGFLKTVNAAFATALEKNADIILLNSDTVVFPGAFTEMRHVAYCDSMIGFVSPRSNNATICTVPQQTEFQNLEPAQSYAVFKEIARYLPRFRYVPTAVGFCLFIKFDIINEFGFFDEAFGKGYNEENDLIVRANRYGYRAALANHGFVYHMGEQSFSISGTSKAKHEEHNSVLLNTRYPEYLDSVTTYFKGVHYEAERLLGGLIPDSAGLIDVVFDCSHFGAYHNGTFKATAKIIQHAAASWGDRFNLYVLATAEAAHFHGLTSIPGALITPPDTTRAFGIAFRFGQPFDYDAILRMSRLAPINVYAMLDTIAWDCLYLNTSHLDDLWCTVARYSDGLLYISDFNRDQFRLRFPVRPGMPEKASYLSLCPADYYLDQAGSTTARSNPYSGHFLVVGNSFSHKYVEPTVRAITRHMPRTKVVALGLNSDLGQNVTSYTSGQLAIEEIHSLFAGARAIIFPSTYEGFGIPIMEALSHRKRVFAREGPLNRSIHQRLAYTQNLVLYSSTKALVPLLEGLGTSSWIDDGFPSGKCHSWASHAREIRELLDCALASFSYERSLIPRLDYMRLVVRSGLQSQPVLPPADADQLQAVVLQNLYPGRQEQAQDGIPDTNLVLRALERHYHNLEARLQSITDNQSQAPPVDDRLVELAKVLTDREDRISQLELVLRDRDTKIRDILNSLSWNVTSPLRVAGGLWLKLFGKQ